MDADSHMYVACPATRSPTTGTHHRGQVQQVHTSLPLIIFIHFMSTTNISSVIIGIITV